MPPSFSPAAFGRELRFAMADDNLSLRQLEAIVGVDQASIHRAAKKELPPSVQAYFKLRWWLDQRPPSAPDQPEEADGEQA